MILYFRWPVFLLLVIGLAGCWEGSSNTPSKEIDAFAPTFTNGPDDPMKGFNSPSRTSARFADVADQSGVTFTYQNGQDAGHFSIVESLGGGVALIDYDGDGNLDLFFPGGGEFGPDGKILGRPPALFRHEGGWRFTEVVLQARADLAPYYSHGVAAADYDNDGFPDLLVTGYGGLLLFHNQGDGTFQEVGAAAGLNDRLWSTSAAWGDLNGDGHLDLYVTRYVNWSFENHPFCAGPKAGQRDVCSPQDFEPLPDILYASNGDGTFRDVSHAVGLRIEGDDLGKGLGVLLADVDLDGDLDIYVANDTVPNFLYRNNGKGQFKEVGLLSGTSLSDSGVPDGSMGVDLGDFNLDGLPDLWVANFERESFALYRNEGNCAFQHVSRSVGVSAVRGLYVAWGTMFFDFDRDGDEDIFVSNGHVIRYPVNAPLRQAPLLFENHEGKRFQNVAPAAGAYLNAAHMGRGVVSGDIDNDGDLDIVISNVNESVAVLSNESANQNRWISLRLAGTKSNRDAIGARVRIRTGQNYQTRQLKGGTSYASSSDHRLFFGLGKAGMVEEIEIHWPSGNVQVLRNVSVDQVLLIHETSP